MRKRARWNVVIALSLAAFVVAVFVVSFAHIQSEDGPPAPAQRQTSE
jgi:ABC-type transporter Mla subunit MlaD